MLENWYQHLTGLPAGETMNMAFWQTVLEVRSAVSKELEALRADKTIGSSLDAEVILYADDELQQVLRALGEELRFVLITSGAEVRNISDADDDCIEAKITDASGVNRTIRIRASASAHGKCVRCWHHREDVGSVSDHPELCGRCVENVAGNGELRSYA